MRDGNTDDIDLLLEGAYPSLRELFEHRIKTLNISTRQAWTTLDIDARTLNNLLDGEAKTFDAITFLKLANFLQVSPSQLINFYVSSVFQTNKVLLEPTEKKAFILNHLDLKSLKKAGFISNESDYNQIENRLKSFFEIDTLEQYQNLYSNQVAFSTNSRRGTLELSRVFWVKSAISIFRTINNPNPFNRDRLLEIFPTLKNYSLNVDEGLLQVARVLFEVGVTVIYLPKLPGLNVRGATLSVAAKPCIVITDASPFYPTLWFALIHELIHVLRDWEDFLNHPPHLSFDADDEDFEHNERENNANHYARQYLLADKYFDTAANHINDQFSVYALARELNIHPSFIYSFYCWDYSPYNKKVYSKFRFQMPDIDGAIKSLVTFSWNDNITLKSIGLRKKEIFKTKAYG